MLRRTQALIGLKVQATDGQLGRLVDIYFDDHTWRVRYLVVGLDEGPKWREVLLSPAAAGRPDWTARAIPVALTVQQVRASPDVKTDLPVSRVQEAALASYYEWGPWWAMPVPLGEAPVVLFPTRGPDADNSIPPGDPNLRSVEEVVSYSVHASDGNIGRVEDFIVQTDEWVIRYLLARTRKWLPGRRVLISPAWLERVDWPARLVHVNLTREDLRHGPEFDPASLLDRAYETRLHESYARQPYWYPD